MSDLDKLMAKMNSNKQLKENPVDQSTPTPIKNVPQCPANVPQPTEILDDEDDDVNDTEEIEQVPIKQEDNQNSIEQEVAVLQNIGIFRREIVLIEKEKVDVLKVMTQTLLDIKKKLLGEEDAPKK